MEELGSITSNVNKLKKKYDELKKQKTELETAIEEIRKKNIENSKKLIGLKEELCKETEEGKKLFAYNNNGKHLIQFTEAKINKNHLIEGEKQGSSKILKTNEIKDTSKIYMTGNTLNLEDKISSESNVNATIFEDGVLDPELDDDTLTLTQNEGNENKIRIKKSKLMETEVRVCTICSKVLGKNSYSRHYRVCSNQCVLKLCPYCNYKSKQKCNLKKHLQRCHSDK